MRKKMLGLVAAALTIGSFGAFAQSEGASSSSASQEQVIQCDTPSCNKSEPCKKKKGDHGDKKMKKAGHKANPFAGIELTSEQQSKLEALKTEQKAKKEEQKKLDKQARAKEREAFNKEVEKILTPEQFKVYQANCDSLKAKKHMKERVHSHKEGKKDHKKKKNS